MAILLGDTLLITMFTGIIRHLGKIAHIEQLSDGATQFEIVSELASEISEGDSVAVNGACLTAIEIQDDRWVIRLMQETLEKTSLGDVREGGSVNLERSLAVGEHLDGHFVMGHVDGVVEIVKIDEAGGDRVFTFSLPSPLAPYLIPKGSVCLNGVSLTVVDVFDDSFTVSMMPYTLEHTTFGSLSSGAAVNIEVDMLGKYVLRYLEQRDDS